MGGVRITEACRKGLRFPQLHFRIGIQILSDSTEVVCFFWDFGECYTFYTVHDRSFNLHM